ncbi:hypothetical protein CU098_008461 [Rhizopus stolonifer]|uniref:Mid2 domain-containing protein n=1 Tax=Rhizopus stolonifer TaxID=4846 RepID=A0A367IYF9_RHIST|nr:hypothetical protein CU098_008461 [Rhizopus stolonifer]
MALLKHWFLLSCLLFSFVLAQNVTSIETVNSTSTTDSIISTMSSSLTAEPTFIPSSTIPSSTETIDATSSYAMPTVQSTGFTQNGNQPADGQQSWLKEHNRFVFIIFIGLLVLGLLVWYIYRSIKGMRKRLERENQDQLYMMQQTHTNDAIGNDRVILEGPISPPPAYKTHENTPVSNH